MYNRVQIDYGARKWERNHTDAKKGGALNPEQVEISSLNLRYETFRLKAPGAEKTLLASILENGIRDPLQGVDREGERILLDGFKRYRCARKLNIGIVPYISLGNDEACGIIELIRISNAKGLSILEQARLIDELKSVHQISTADIARLLEKSASWVSVRTGILKEMSETVRAKIFSGQFPVYSFMYTLRSFMRLNSVKSDEVDDFVKSVAGMGLSVRDIDLLAHGYFKGSNDFREQIRNGNISWGLERLKQTRQPADECTNFERGFLNVIEITLKYMQKLTARCQDKRYKTGAFYAQANLLSGGIIRQIEPFSKAIRNLHDQTRQA
ncbi:MAG: chromosome partitioning protein ParB [Desulfobacterales bacterium]|jgi:hypothetical protein